MDTSARIASSKVVGLVIVPRVTSWREAGFPDDEGLRVRNWVISKLKSAEDGMESLLTAHPTGLEDHKVGPGDYLQVDNPHMARLDADRKKWKGMLDGIDQGQSAAFLKAHAEWQAAREEGTGC